MHPLAFLDDFNIFNLFILPFFSFNIFHVLVHSAIPVNAQATLAQTQSRLFFQHEPEYLDHHLLIPSVQISRNMDQNREPDTQTSHSDLRYRLSN